MTSQKSPQRPPKWSIYAKIVLAKKGAIQSCIRSIDSLRVKNGCTTTRYDRTLILLPRGSERHQSCIIYLRSRTIDITDKKRWSQVASSFVYKELSNTLDEHRHVQTKCRKQGEVSTPVFWWKALMHKAIILVSDISESSDWVWNVVFSCMVRAEKHCAIIKIAAARGWGWNE
jgi:hypothetical protein